MIQKMSFDLSFDDAAMPRFGSDSMPILFALKDAFGTGDGTWSFRLHLSGMLHPRVHELQ